MSTPNFPVVFIRGGAKYDSGAIGQMQAFVGMECLKPTGLITEVEGRIIKVGNRHFQPDYTVFISSGEAIRHGWNRAVTIAPYTASGHTNFGNITSSYDPTA